MKKTWVSKIPIAKPKRDVTSEILKNIDTLADGKFEKMAAATPPASDGGLRLPKAQLCDIITI
jgi:hypothetical protein